MQNSFKFPMKGANIKFCKQTSQSALKHYKVDLNQSSCLKKFKKSGADQFLSDRRGADFPGGCIGALPKRLLGFRSFKNTLY